MKTKLEGLSLRLRIHPLPSIVLFGLLSLNLGVIAQPLRLIQEPRLVGIRGLPFCAFIYYEDKNDSRSYVRILMDQVEITQDNLRTLFQRISEEHPSSLPLEVQVDIDLRTAGAIANGELHSIAGRSSPNNNGSDHDRKSEASNVEAPHGAFYMRTETVELFRYNPNYPKFGMKTVILRGKE